MGGRSPKIALAAATFLVALVAAELALEWIGRGRTGRPEGDPAPYYPWSMTTSGGAPVATWGFLELALHPFALYHNLPGQRSPYHSTDARGFRRTGAPGYEASPRARVALVGGSAAFGTGLRSDRETFAARLGALLDDVEVVNAAVVGHLSGQELSYALAEVVDLEPDLILALDGWNDLVGQMEGPTRSAHTTGVNNAFFDVERRLRRLYRLEQGGLAQRGAAALGLAFRNLARLLVQASERSAPALLREGPVDPALEVEREPEALAALYARNMVKLDRVSAAFGARFLCLLQPEREAVAGRASLDRLGRWYAAFRSEARRRLREAEVLHRDLNERGEVLRAGMFMDRVHLDAKGNRALAELVRRTIRREGLLRADALAGP